MSDNSHIEWTDATWNPVTGCTKVSPGCDHCYAERVTERFHGKGSFAKVTLHPGRLDQPLRWRRPRRVFVNSMSDLFHQDVPDELIVKAFAVMTLAPQHTFQVLTKRHGRMRSLLSGDFSGQITRTLLDDPQFARLGRWPVPSGGVSWPLPNVWLGVSVENQQWADIRIPELLHTPAAVRFLSCEPLLGPVNIPSQSFLRRLDWVIVGGESGPNARPMHPQWARDLRDQCQAAGVPFFFKQWGEWAPTGWRGVGYRDDKHMYVGPALDAVGLREEIARVGKKAAGRELDGRTWDEFPKVSA